MFWPDALFTATPSNWKLFCSGAAPLTAMFVVPRPKLVPPATDALTPADKPRIAVKLRLLSGRFVIVVPDTVVPAEELPV